MKMHIEVEGEEGKKLGEIMETLGTMINLAYGLEVSDVFIRKSDNIKNEYLTLALRVKRLKNV